MCVSFVIRDDQHRSVSRLNARAAVSAEVCEENIATVNSSENGRNCGVIDVFGVMCTDINCGMFTKFTRLTF